MRFVNPLFIYELTKYTFRVYNYGMSIEGNKEENKDMLTVPEAAAESNLAQTTIRNAIYRGKLTATNVYGRPIIERSEFERYRAATKMGRPKGSVTCKDGEEGMNGGQR